MGKNLDNQLRRRTARFAAEVHRRKSTEGKLRKTNEALCGLLEASPAAITLLDKEGSVQVWNHAAERIFGWTVKEVLGRPLPTIPSGKQDEHRLLRERVLRGESFTGVEVHRQRKDGALVHISLSAAPVHDAQGRVTGIVGVMTDITDRENAKEEGRRCREDYRELVESVNDGFIMQDESGIIIYVNQKMCQMLACTQEEIVDHRMTDFYDEAGKAVYQHQMSKQRKGEREQYSTGWVRKDGRKLETIVSSEPKFDEDGNFKGSVSVVTDITELRELEEKLRHIQRMESLGALAGGIAHDFNNILGVILGYASRLEEEGADQANLRPSLEGIKKAIERGSGLVRQILTFTRESHLALESIDINTVIDQVSRMLRITFPKNIGISLQLHRDLPSVMGDPSQLYQALVNLCINARDAMMPDEGVLLITTEAVPGADLKEKFHDVQDGNYVSVNVTDTGKGMDESTQSHIFEPFFTTKEVGNGTGLGLSVVYAIVQSHRGLIECESQVGKGTAFRLYFPVVSQDDGSISGQTI